MDPLREHAAYIELLHAVRTTLSLGQVATYLGSKPQNIAGWVAARSVPTLKDFRARLVEIGFFLTQIVEADIGLSPLAQQIVADHPPLLPPWGVRLGSGAGETANAQAAAARSDDDDGEGDDEPSEAEPVAAPKRGKGKGPEGLAALIAGTVRDMLPGPGSKGAVVGGPAYTWAKLAQLRDMWREEKGPREKQRLAKATVDEAIVIWGEACAGRSTLANALLGAETFATSPLPRPPQLQVLAAAGKALVVAPATDGPAPSGDEALQLLRYLLNARVCHLFLVFSSQAFPLPRRLAFAQEMALLPVTLNIVFSKLDLYTAGDEREVVMRYLTGRFAATRLHADPGGLTSEAGLSELRAAAGLVGTARFKLVAAARTDNVPTTTQQLSEQVARVLQQVAKLGPQPLSTTSSLQALGLGEAAIGAALVELERVFNVKFPDRDADLALRGQNSAQWLAEIIQALK